MLFDHLLQTNRPAKLLTFQVSTFTIFEEKYYILLSPSNICTETNKVTKHFAQLKEAFPKRGYQETKMIENRLSHRKQQTKKKMRSQPKSFWSRSIIRKILSNN